MPNTLTLEQKAATAPQFLIYPEWLEQEWERVAESDQLYQ